MRGTARRIATRAWLAAGLALAAGGCGGHIPETHYYVLNLAAPAPQPRDPAPYTTVIMPFRAAEQLEQDRIVYRPSAVEVEYYEYHRWAQRPAASLTAALAERLRAQHAFSEVSVFDGRMKGDYLIRGRLERLEEVDSPENVSVQAALSAEVVEVKTSRTIWSGSASQSQPVSEGEVKAVVEAMSRAVDACLAQLATGLDAFAKSLPRAPAPASAASR
ncbi:MAG TPA: ABC-type transport auxiliary lipoprotein family protein [Bryobacterales bacterium]|nr:ABC-type transport auxiliary lipoprotein family protein [Bryobacterales bacterium]